MSKGKLADKAGCGTDRPLATAGKALRAGGPGRRRQGPATHHDRASGNSRSALRGSERLEPARPPPPAASLGLRRCHPPRPTPPRRPRSPRIPAERRRHRRLGLPAPTTAQPPGSFPPSLRGAPIGRPRGNAGRPLGGSAAAPSGPPPHPHWLTETRRRGLYVPRPSHFRKRRPLWTQALIE